ncbi:MAG: aminopeptidase P family protein [Bacteroidetes bacterium]|nr:MAG: aminopeptidase P family protein [Bacteroidota bacterium]
MPADRLPRLRLALAESGLDGLVLIPGSNLRYLTGFTPMLSKRVVLAVFPAADRPPALALPRLEAPGVRAHLGDAVTYHPWDDATGPDAAVEAALRQTGLTGTVTLGVEYAAMRVQDLRALERAAAAAGGRVDVRDATQLIGRMRMVKDADELAAMEAAARVVEEALRRTIEQIAVGKTERELAAFCANAILAAGAEGLSFDAFVATGPNTANPHHEPGDRPVQAGDLVMIDCGAVVGGFASDITRTVAVGDPGEDARRIYDVVLAANAAGKRAVRPGATGEAIDRATRAVIEEAGYGPYFVHRTGHGLGMETFPCHEYPDIVQGSTDPLPVGTTFTIEPGIYLEGVGGVRIEDDVVVTPDGHRSLTHFPRDLMVLTP